MPIDRATILKGPGHITFDGATILSDGDIEATMIVETEDVATSSYGPVDARIVDKRIEVTVTPKKWRDLGKLLPYATHQIGQSLYGAADIPLVMITGDATLTVANARVTSLPSLNLRTRGGGTILGSMTFTGLIANNANPAAAASYYALSGGGNPPTLALSDIVTDFWSGSWDGTPIRGDEGFQVNFELETAAQVDDETGTYDMRLQSLRAVASVTPRGMTAAAMAALLSMGGGIGTAPAKHDLAITSGFGHSVTLKNCLARQGQIRAGADAHRTGTLEFATVRTVNAGELEALWLIGEPE